MYSEESIDEAMGLIKVLIPVIIDRLISVSRCIIQQNWEYLELSFAWSLNIGQEYFEILRRYRLLLDFGTIAINRIVISNFHNGISDEKYGNSCQIAQILTIPWQLKNTQSDYQNDGLIKQLGKCWPIKNWH